MGKKYKIRATSLVTYYSYVDSDHYPDIFDEEGNPKGYQMYMDGSVEKVQDSDFDLFDKTWDYGIDPVNEDWEFTDYEVISDTEYSAEPDNHKRYKTQTIGTRGNEHEVPTDSPRK